MSSVHAASTENLQITEEGTLGENISFTIYENGLVEISGSGSMNEFETSPFKNPELITSVVFSSDSSVKGIGSLLFAGCSSLENIMLPETIEYIGVGAFSNCSSLTEIIIPDSVTVIRTMAFADCSSLNFAAIGSGIKSVNSSDNASFKNYIDPSAFEGCYNITELSMPSLISGISTSEDETSVLPAISIFGEYTGDYKVKKITLTSGNCIDICAFNGMFSLEEIIIPDTVTKIKDGAFYECPNIKDIYYNSSEKAWKSINISEGNDILSKATVHFNETNSAAAVRGSGDIDGNGVTELTDLTHLSLYLLHEEEFDENQLIAADLTKDGEVAINDLPALKMIISKA